MISNFFLVLFLAFLGLVLCTVMERFVKPRPCFCRPLLAWSIHTGISLLLYGLLVFILARPYFSLVILLATMLIFVVGNNTKLRSLGEPLTAQDLKSVKDIFLRPRLFLPYLGVKSLFFLSLGCIAVFVGCYFEPAPSERLRWSGQGGATFLLLSMAALCLSFAYFRTNSISLHALQIRFLPMEDIRRFGLLTTLWIYAFALRDKPTLDAAPFLHVQQRRTVPSLPHLIAIQSESFFDPRRLFPNIRADVLTKYDVMCHESIQHGLLQVPAFGANTMRTEFSFLTGITEECLNAHRFNPYALAATDFYIPSFFHILKKLGYTIILVHPYVKEFFNRHKVFANFQVDHFIDGTHFSKNDCYGPYVGDIPVAQKILEIIHSAKNPTCVFAITMENHGPLHLEKVQAEDIAALYDTSPPQDFENLTTYLRHLRHADVMISMLHDTLQNHSSPTSICWYGDHKPIMPKIYDTLPSITTDTNYFFWNNSALEDMHKTHMTKEKGKHISLVSHELASCWLNNSLWKLST